MIRTLRIQNFALIDEVEVNFNAGFTVITGETGSGKSILVNALNLLLGERANFDVIGNAGNKATVEGEIDLRGFGLSDFFLEHDLDYYDNCIIRREVSTQGRSRAFVNDTPVQLTVLKALTSQLVHIHSQYNTLDLKARSYQLFILDALAGLLSEREKVTNIFKDWKIASNELNALKQQSADIVAQSDYDSFQLNELISLDLDNTNYEELQERLNTSSNAESLQQTYGEVIDGLSNDSQVLDQLRSMLSILYKSGTTDSSILERLNASLIELEDVSAYLESKLNELNINPEELRLTEERMDAYNHALFKHKCNDQKGLLSLKQSLEAKSHSSEELIEEIEKLESDLARLNGLLLKSSEELHQKRKASLTSIENNIIELLSELKLGETKLEFSFSQLEDCGEFGKSAVEIMFSPNPGVALIPVHRAASGGELSRVMLALQSLLAEKTKLRSILFDEIDTGVSGEVAQKVGETLKRMGAGMQVIAISHLPQVAAKGAKHLKVSKKVQDGVTNSMVQELNSQERVEEIARLMSGDTINDAALENARSLINHEA